MITISITATTCIGDNITAAAATAADAAAAAAAAADDDDDDDDEEDDDGDDDDDDDSPLFRMFYCIYTVYQPYIIIYNYIWLIFVLY